VNRACGRARGGSGVWQAHPRVAPEVSRPLGSHYV
jgi:hypothetical protein